MSADLAPQHRTRGLGLSWLAILGLVALAVPRIVLHDLHLAGPVLNAVLAVVPLAIWLTVVLWARVPNPWLTLFVVGVIYGVVLALTHQLLWEQAHAGSPPRLGGNLADLSPTVHAALTRGFAVVSSLVTGTVIGAILGGIAWLLTRLGVGRRTEKG